MRSLTERKSCFDWKTSETNLFADKFLFHYQLTPATPSITCSKATSRSQMFSRKLENRKKKENVQNKYSNRNTFCDFNKVKKKENVRVSLGIGEAEVEMRKSHVIWINEELKHPLEERTEETKKYESEFEKLKRKEDIFQKNNHYLIKKKPIKMIVVKNNQQMFKDDLSPWPKINISDHTSILEGHN